MYQKIELKDTEILKRVFFRGEGEAHTSLGPIDFERRPHLSESGISIFREDLISDTQIFEITKMVRAKQARGLATIEAGELKRLGYQFFVNTEATNGEAHICMHCSFCNEAESNCQPNSGNCPIHPDQTDDEWQRQLADLFQIDTNPALFQDIMKQLLEQSIDRTS